MCSRIRIGRRPSALTYHLHARAFVDRSLELELIAAPRNRCYFSVIASRTEFET